MSSRTERVACLLCLWSAYHVHLNALRSNIVLTDDNQNPLVRYEYDLFGAIRSETGTSDNTRKFTGKEFDADSSLNCDRVVLVPIYIHN